MNPVLETARLTLREMSLVDLDFIAEMLAHPEGLELLLSMDSDEDCPDFVPGLEVFLAVLADGPLPARTQAMLMRHYEQHGAFGKAEDVLFDLLEAEPANAALLDFGIGFYERLRSQTDLALTSGNLPRQELEAGLAELCQRRASRS